MLFLWLPSTKTVRRLAPARCRGWAQLVGGWDLGHLGLGLAEHWTDRGYPQQRHKKRPGQVVVMILSVPTTFIWRAIPHHCWSGKLFRASECLWSEGRPLCSVIPSPACPKSQRLGLRSLLWPSVGPPVSGAYRKSDSGSIRGDPGWGVPLLIIQRTMPPLPFPKHLH